MERLRKAGSELVYRCTKQHSEQRLAQLGGGAQAAGTPLPSTTCGQGTATQLASVAGSVDVATALTARIGAQSTI